MHGVFFVPSKRQTKGLSLGGGANSIRKKALMEPGPAEREALRGTFDHSYYGYPLGKLFIKKARERFFHAHPDEPIRTFHDKLLGLGCAPVGHLESLIT